MVWIVIGRAKKTNDILIEIVLFQSARIGGARHIGRKSAVEAIVPGVRRVTLGARRPGRWDGAVCAEIKVRGGIGHDIADMDAKCGQRRLSMPHHGIALDELPPGRMPGNDNDA